MNTPVAQKEKKYFQYNQVLEKALDYFNGDELAATTWMKKYAVKNEDGLYEETTPDDMHK